MKSKKNNILGVLELSPLQEGILFDKSYSDNISNYHIQNVFSYKGRLSEKKLNLTLNFIAQKYPVLKSKFVTTKTGSNWQVFVENNIPKSTMLSFESKEKQTVISSMMAEDIARPFSPENGDVFRLSFSEITENETVLLISFHHIIMDGWSLSILFSDFLKYYSAIDEAKSENTVQKMLNNERKFDYIKYREQINRKNLNEANSYWSSIVSNYKNTKKLPFKTKEKTSENQVSKETMEISKEVSSKLINLAAKSQVSLSSLIETCWGVLLQKYYNTKDIVFGKIVSGRNENFNEIEKAVGLFINTIPVRIILENDDSIIELIRKTQIQNLNSEKFDYYPLYEIQKKSKVPLFETLFVFENYFVEQSLKQERGWSIENNREQVDYDITLTVSLNDNLIKTSILFNPQKFSDFQIRQMLEHLLCVFETIVENEEIKVDEITVCSVNDKKTILENFNDTKVDFPSDVTVVELFEKIVNENSQKIAISINEREITYSELNIKSNQLARTLRDKGVKTGSYVALLTDRGIEMVVGILGIIKAGGVYVPIDVDLPQKRIEYILSDCRPTVVVSNKTSIETNITIIPLECDDSYSNNGNNLERVNKPSDLIYTIYTSGTTGKPKGVLIEHGNVIKLVKNNGFIKWSREKRILQAGSYSFDSITFELWGALLNGIELAIVDKDTFLNFNKLEKFVSRRKITTAFFTTALFNQIVLENIDVFDHIDSVIYGGEQNSPKLVELLLTKKRKIKILHAYGPTEATTFSTIHQINALEKNKKNIIGKPISNTYIYIMKNKKLCGIGIPGELCIAGKGVARGYLNQRNLTKEKFISNPFGDGTMYKSGDLARWLPDGTIEYMGRIDNQVKLRGFRIELSEVESALLNVEGIIECAVTLRLNNENIAEDLNVYYVSNKSFDSKSILKYLKRVLPSYMIPNYYLRMDRLPLTNNGKIDKRSLPIIEKESTIEYVQPKTRLEKQIASAFEKVLFKESIGIDDDFFELGGHSLRAAKVVNQLRVELQTEIEVRNIFEYSSVRELAQYLGDLEKSNYHSIPIAENKQYYEMTSSQKRLFFLEKLNPKSIIYNMPGSLSFYEEIDLDRLELALYNLFKRHEILRTTFHMFKGKAVQKIHEFIQPDIRIISERNNLVRPFDLETGPLVRVYILKNESGFCEIFFDMHHIISDGMSLKIFIDELTSLYRGETLRPLKLQYKDYSEWINSKDLSKQQTYWHKILENSSRLELLTDYQRPQNRDFSGKTYSSFYGKEIFNHVREIAKERHVSEYMVVLSALMIVLSHYSHQEDILIGTPVSGRIHKDTEELLGMFVNTLVLRAKPNGEKNYGIFINEIKQLCLDNLENQEYPFEQLVEETITERDLSRNPLFDVIYNWQNNEVADGVLGKYTEWGTISENNVSKFDLAFNFQEASGNLQVGITYCKSLFSEKTIELLFHHLKTTLLNLPKSSDVRIKDIQINDLDEVNEVINFNQIEFPEKNNKFVIDLFEEQVNNHPEKVALIFENKKISYRELNQKANQLGRYLRDYGVGPNDLVAIVTERSFEMIISILGILKAGGAYIPIDPDTPEGRIQYILSDSHPKLVLTYKVELSTQLFSVDLSDPSVFNRPNSNLKKVNSINDLAYCIYTSGTTGSPKGVLIEHGSVLNYCIADHGFRDLFIKENSTVLSLTTYGFDIFINESIYPLTHGSKIIITNKEEQANSHELLCLVEKYGVTVIGTTPSKIKLILEDKHTSNPINSLELLILGGEVLKEKLVDEIVAASDADIYNCYGPTEATVLVTESKIEKNKSITIGKPVPNSSIFIMNDGYICGIGVPGELCIAGKGVARGYLNRPELTNERFVDNPFGEGKLYRSGDLARWLPDGNLEYLGRMDDQIKLRGFRIELAEIENALREIDGVVNSAVTVKFSSSNEPEALNAYYVTDSNLANDEIRSNLKKVLPSYMVPQYYLELDALPITSNGKLDRKALPEITVTSSNAYCAPETKTQKVLVSAFEDILEKELIGIDDDFFELGGHSLRAARLTNHLSAMTKKKVQVRDIFEYPTVRLLAEHLESEADHIYQSIPVAEEKEVYAMTSAQRRLYLLDQLNPESIVYNLPGQLEFTEALDIDKLKSALYTLVQRHEILRTTFHLQNEQAVQKIHDDLKPEIRWHQEGEPLVRPFDLEEGPLVRVTILENEPTHSTIFFDMHHIISDGASLKIFADELTALYQEKQLPELNHQHKDYSEWLNLQDMEASKEYWHTTLKDPVQLELPTDYSRPKNRSFKGKTFGTSLGVELSKQIKELAHETKTTEYMIGLSALMILLSRYSQQDDIIIGSAVSGRTHKDTESMLGMFVNTLAFRGHPTKEKTYSSFLNEIKTLCLENYAHQEYPFEELVEDLVIERDQSRSPLFDVMFNWQNNEQITSAVNDTFKHSYLFDEIASKFDISFSVSEGKGEYLLSVTYRSDLYDEKTIQYLVEHFRTILTQVLNSSKRERAIYELSTTSEEEKKKLLEVFNKAESNSQSSQTLVDLFEISVEKNPLKTALVFKDKELSFQSLNEKANQLARKLRERGVRSNTLVPLITESSMEMVIGILGILKAGGAYVPVDPKLSDERIDHILSDCSAEVVVTNQKKIRQSISVIDLTIQEVFSGESRNLNLIRKAEDLAYCIYTSGTTGHPKGVLVEHHSIVDYVQFDKWKLDVSESLFLSKYHFDLGYTTFYLSLLNGGCLHLIDEEIVLEPYLLVDYLIQNKITLFKMTPSQLATLIDVMYIYSPQKFKYLKHVIVGGEEIRSEDLYKLQEWLPEVELFNHYGPTETTIGVLVSPIDKEVLMRKNSILGRPINHNQIYIMNDDQLSGIGVPGEIYIAGEGVSRGYLNQPELTKKKFVKNPFHKGKMYRSGDLARWLPNGNIEYLGRIDDQIKLHGFRIELAEIENTLRALKNIIDCVVSVRTSEQGDPEGLNAYYVCATPLDSSEIRGQLTQLLPSYMVPQYYKELSAIPVTANGKVDRKSLPEIETASYSVYVAPKTELEVLLATNFEKILEKESIGIDDNFFDLGGHSLRAAHLINLLQPLLEKQIFVRDLFEHPTVRSLANYLETGKMFSYQSIPKAEEKEYYEMPSAQKRMYLLYKLDPESITYNMPRHLTFSKSLNINNLRSTLQKMVERHEILRTTFHLFNDQPVQKIHSHLEIDFEEITEDVTRKLVQPFDLENGPLFRVRVIKKENETWSLFLDMHHIISDGLSIKVFSDELSSLYQGNLLPLPERQYKDYSEWLNHKDYSRQQKYWHTLLKNPVQLNIPTDYPRPKNRSTAGKTIFNSFGKELSHQIKRIAKQRRVSEYMVVLSALMVVLSRYGQQEDIMIGSPVSGRTHKDTELMLGLFANTLVFRGYPEKEKTFATFLDEIKHMCLSNYDYQEYPFENLVDELVTDRDFSRNPLFDVMLIWQNNEKVTQVLNEEIGFEIDNRLETTKFDLSLTVRENQGEYQFAFTYSTDLYQEETIEKIAGHLCTFLGHISPEGETRIEEVSMVDEEEEVYLTKVLNDTKQEYPKGDTIVDLFEKSVQRNEEKTAVIFEGKEITYQELNRKANQLARDLRRQGVKPDNLVAMITTRSVEMLIGILGILKAGGAYVPIDPNFPAERIHYILSDAKPKVILTYGTTIETNTPVIDLKTDEWKQNEDTNLPKVNTPKDLVYCLYTSGTTGNPKGVLIEHQNLVNYCTVDHEFDGNAIACTTNYTFDIFGTEFFWPLVNGKKVIYFFEDFDMSCSDWQFVDMLNTTPTKLRIIIENHSGILQSGQIKNILLIGEELTYTFLTDIKKHTDAKIYNCYGPTEATILVSEFKAVHTPKITIGKPSKNCQIYIMSGNQLNGIGITGELCIAGDGVGRGYLNRPELTNERFVENPFGEGKLYRSGDLARWLPDGNLEYLGRMDDQIKLRGFRIELAEIENTLREIDGVVNSAVTVKFSSSNEPEALNAYYVTSIELSVEEIRSNLKKVLPSYMVPQYYLELDALPITSNGKLDRKALPEIAVTSSNAYCAPETKTQKVLVSAFEDILEKELIGIDDDFFELGGHSLKAAQLTNHLSALTKKEVKVRDIFEYSTVRLLARHLENQKELSNETIPFADKKDYYKMTSAQKRLYLLDQLNPESIVYNMPGQLEFSEALDIDKLENALWMLIQRHEILRTTFHLQNEQAVQKIHDDLKPEIRWHQEGEPLVRPFDLEEGPLVRVTILENEPTHSTIFFDMHHIISDGASLKIFADELTALYQEKQLPELNHQHKDYSEWLNQQDMEVSKKYWHTTSKDPKFN
jgi:tyrocidine synthetase-3